MPPQPAPSPPTNTPASPHRTASRQTLQLEDAVLRACLVWATRAHFYGRRAAATLTALLQWQRARLRLANHAHGLETQQGGGASACAERRERVSWAAGVEQREGRCSRRFCRPDVRYRPGRYAGELLDTSGKRMSFWRFYDVEEIGWGVKGAGEKRVGARRASV
ncbi:hypothetical protein NpPPO83_00000550 [Neofusicoccum parvum]|uniref:Uncharacterized protein n=1 Tax=Neofusicoccum parvum TaxID=310453 RepID=A0ACB5RXV1_9PEZI|nr:hypothetical protein NpPPO83_00000550 [Neofusicoccum parvum]